MLEHHHNHPPIIRVGRETAAKDHRLLITTDIFREVRPYTIVMDLQLIIRITTMGHIYHNNISIEKIK
jgi:hypothetical protein